MLGQASRLVVGWLPHWLDWLLSWKPSQEWLGESLYGWRDKENVQKTGKTQAPDNRQLEGISEKSNSIQTPCLPPSVAKKATSLSSGLMLVNLHSGPVSILYRTTSFTVWYNSYIAYDLFLNLKYKEILNGFD
jgi:hypothetical protein